MHIIYRNVLLFRKITSLSAGITEFYYNWNRNNISFLKSQLPRNEEERYVTFHNAALNHCDFRVAAAVILATFVASFLLQGTDMLITTIAQAVVFCAQFGMEIVLLTLESHVIAQQITIWTLTFFQTFGLWNILALYLTLKSYREKVRHVLYLRVTKQHRRVSDGIALPDIANDSRAVCPYKTAQTA